MKSRIESIISGEPVTGLWPQRECREQLTAAVTEIRTLREKHGEPANPGQSDARLQLEAIISGENPAPTFATQKAWHAMFELAANDLRTLRAKGAAKPAAKPAATNSPASSPKPSTAPAAAKPAAPVIAGTTTAEQFRASQSKTTMSRAEFDKLTHAERNAFMRSGGKLA